MSLLPPHTMGAGPAHIREPPFCTQRRNLELREQRRLCREAVKIVAARCAKNVWPTGDRPVPRSFEAPLQASWRLVSSLHVSCEKPKPCNFVNKLALQGGHGRFCRTDPNTNSLNVQGLGLKVLRLIWGLGYDQHYLNYDWIPSLLPKP